MNRGEDEEDVFESVDLAYIPQDLREDRGEVEAANAVVDRCLSCRER